MKVAACALTEKAKVTVNANIAASLNLLCLSFDLFKSMS